FQIDDEFEFDRLDNRQVRRFGSFENLSGVDANLAISLRKTDTVAHEAAPHRIFAELVDSRLTPVALPPGRLILSTRPIFTGSPPVMNTNGIEDVAPLAASAEGSPPVATSTDTPR